MIVTKLGLHTYVRLHVGSISDRTIVRRLLEEACDFITITYDIITHNIDTAKFNFYQHFFFSCLLF